MKLNRPMKVTLKKLAPAIMISLIATSLGLLSLYQSRVPMIQDFGLMLSIGIAVAFVFAVFILLPILYLSLKYTKKEPKEGKEVRRGRFEEIAYNASSIVIKLRYFVLILAVVGAALGFYFDQEVGVETDIETFIPQDSDMLADIEELRDILGSTDRITLMYSSDDILSFETLNDLRELTTSIEEVNRDVVVSSTSVVTLLDILSDEDWNEDNYLDYVELLPEEQLKLVVSLDDEVGVINLSLLELDDNEFNTLISNLEEEILNYSYLDITITGQSVVDAEMLDAMTDGRLEMTLIGVLLVFIVLLVLYRNIFKAIIPIVPIVLIIGWSGGIMYLLDYVYTPLTSTLGALVIGIGTEFTILIVMRFYEEKARYSDSTEAIKVAISKISKPIIVSAVTTMGGFSALILSDFEILSNFGIMTLINIGLALISSLIVLPAFIAVLGKQSKVLS